MVNVADYIKEHCSTIGTGDLLLTGSDEGFTRYRDAWVVETQVAYSVIDGANRESGIGTFNGLSNITRDTIKSTLVNGVFNATNPVAINLQGASIVACTLSADMFESTYEAGETVDAHVADLNNPHNTTAYNTTYDAQYDPITSATNVRNALAEHGTAINSSISDISSNADSIAANTSNISVNTSAIDANTTDIATNTTDIATNTTDIATNAADISTNTGDIATNAANIAIVDGDVSYRESAISALETGGGITQNGTTSILVAAGVGEVIDSYTDTENQTTTEVTWLEQTFDLLPNGGMPVATGFGQTEIGVDSAGVIKAFPNGMSAQNRRENIKLGYMEYIDRVIDGITNSPIVSNQTGNTLLDLIYFIPASSRIKGLLLRPTNLGNLTLWRDSGYLFSPGSNYENSKVDQNIRTIPAVGAEDTAISFNVVTYNNGVTGVGAELQEVPADLYEPDGAGSVDTVGNGKVVIHYLYETLNGHFFLCYGQFEYGSFVEATNNMFADRSAFLVPIELDAALLLGQVVVTKGTGSWATGVAEVFPVNSITSSGSSGGTSSQAINVAYSDIYGLGTNVQTALDSLAAIKLTPDQNDALDGASAPSAANPFATMLDAGGTTDLAYTAAIDSGVVECSTGTDATIPVADGTNAGLLLPAEKVVIGNTSGSNTGDQDLSAYAPIASPTFTGVPKSPTPADNSETTAIATTGYVDTHAGGSTGELDGGDSATVYSVADIDLDSGNSSTIYN